MTKSDDLVKRLRRMLEGNLRPSPLGKRAADRIEELETKLAKAVEALDEAVYLLAPTESDMEKEAGVYRVVTTIEELKDPPADS